MVYWLMPASSIPIANSTVQHVTTEDMQDPDISQRINQFTQRLNKRLDETNFILEDHRNPPDVYLDYNEDEEDVPYKSE